MLSFGAFYAGAVYLISRRFDSNAMTIYLSVVSSAIAVLLIQAWAMFVAALVLFWIVVLLRRRTLVLA